MCSFSDLHPNVPPTSPCSHRKTNDLHPGTPSPALVVFCLDYPFLVDLLIFVLLSGARRTPSTSGTGSLEERTVSSDSGCPNHVYQNSNGHSPLVSEPMHISASNHSINLAAGRGWSRSRRGYIHPVTCLCMPYIHACIPL